VPPALNWVRADCLQPRPAAAVLDWWLDPGSLTRRLTCLADGEFAVRVLHADWQVLREDECAALGVAPGSLGWVREVLLLGQGQPWVFARSVAAEQALRGACFDLGQIGNQSLGEVLFLDRSFTRGALEICRYPPACLPPQVHAEDLLGRRSCFSREDLNVLVAEVGLPALWTRLGFAV